MGKLCLALERDFDAELDFDFDAELDFDFGVAKMSRLPARDLAM